MKRKDNDLLIVVGLLTVALALRVYAFFNTPVINPDGVLYINQAKAILRNDWELAKTCGYDFISIYHLLIPFGYKVLGDWILAAQSVSLFFGTITIIPLYFVLKHFFRTVTAFTMSLAFATNPFFVSYSVELVKDPIFWFFALLGIWFFITALKREKMIYMLLLSNLSFLIAGLARFEILIYFIGSVTYILFFEDKKMKKILLFTLPVLIIGSLMFLFDAFIFREKLYFWTFYFLPRVHRFFHGISETLLKPPLWDKSLIALKLILYKMTKVLSLPLLPLFLIGFLLVKKEVEREKRFWYFIMLSLLSIVALYLFYMKIGILSPRYTVFIILPAYIFVGFGIEKILCFFKSRGYQEKYILWLVCSSIIIPVVLFPSNLVPCKTDKIIYKKIGDYIAKAENNQTTVVMAPDSRIMFYANLHSEGIECGNQLMEYENLTAMKYHEMVSFLKERKVKYFLWDEKSWKNGPYDFLSTARLKHFKEIMRWDAEQKRLILFKVL